MSATNKTKQTTCHWCLEESPVQTMEEKLWKFWKTISTEDENLTYKNICESCRPHYEKFSVYIERCKANTSIIDQVLSSIQVKVEPVDEPSINISTILNQPLVKQENLNEEPSASNHPTSSSQMGDDRRRNILKVVAMGLGMLMDSFSSSESESSDDDELQMLAHLDGLNRRKVIPRLENYVEQVLPALSDQEFQSHFRMRRETFDYVLSIIGPGLKRQIPGSPMILPEKQFLIAIWRLATSDSLGSLCERFNVGRSTAMYVTRRVTRAVNELSPVFIRWPTGDRVQQIWTGFEAASGLPKVLGAVDGTHVNIHAPSADPESYVNRKGCHSVILQAICDHSGRFLHCFAGHVGSVHVQHVFRLSEVNDYLGDAEKFPDDCHLIGDSAYELHENLLVPYRDNEHLTERQRNYNFCHASARMAIERAFGLLKGRFRSLLTVLPMKKVDLIPAHIIACCVLHNICLLMGDDLLIAVDEGDEDNEPPNMQQDAAHGGAAKRDLICERLLMRVV